MTSNFVIVIYSISYKSKHTYILFDCLIDWLIKNGLER